MNKLVAWIGARFGLVPGVSVQRADTQTQQSATTDTGQPIIQAVQVVVPTTTAPKTEDELLFADLMSEPIASELFRKHMDVLRRGAYLHDLGVRGKRDPALDQLVRELSHLEHDYGIVDREDGHRDGPKWTLTDCGRCVARMMVRA